MDWLERKQAAKNCRLKPKRFVSVFISGISFPPADTRVLPPASSPEEESQQCDQKIFRGEEEERGSVRQGGYKWRPAEAERFEAVDLARLKITK